MLAPHHREDAELGQVRRATHDGDRAREFLGCEPVLAHDLRGDVGALAHAATSPANKERFTTETQRTRRLEFVLRRGAAIPAVVHAAIMNAASPPSRVLRVLRVS